MAVALPAHQRRAAPGPPGLPLVGNLFDLRRDPLQFYPAMRARYGDVVGFRGLRGLRWFLIAHPDDIEYVLKSKDYPKGQIARALRRLVGNGLLTSEGEFWRRQRRLAAPAFHRQRLHTFATMMTTRAAELAERWQTPARTGQPLDIAAEMMRVTLQIVAQALFSTDVSDAAEVVGWALPIALEDVNHRSTHPFTLGEPWPTPRNLRFRRARQALDRIVYRMIEERRQAGHDSGDLLSMLLHARDAETGAAMDDRQLRDEVMTLFLAGHETTAVTLSWTWYLLALHPDIERRLHAELDEVLAGRLPTLEDLPHLPYTRMVIDETLRLYPPAWIFGRQSTVDDELRGYHIPAGAPLVISPYVTHRHPDFWETPGRFEPERFTPERIAQRPRFAYFPFGGGPRICIGNQFALMEAHLLLATLASRYRLRLVRDHPVVPEPTVTLRPKYGMRMLLYERRRAPLR